MDKNLQPHFYQVSGINLESEIPLPDLIKTESPGDVKIHYGEITDSRINDIFGNLEALQKTRFRIKVSEKAIFIDWEKLGKVLIQGGKEVVVEPETGTIEEDWQPFLTGPVLSVLLHQRGFLVLHASAVVIDNAAAVFLGAKGYGKSTLAAQLQVRGHRLISDDIVPVNFVNDDALTVPGYPRIKLFEDSVTAVGENPLYLPLIHRFVEKRSFKCAENFSTEPLAIGGIYVLAETDEVSLEKLSPLEAFIELTKNTYLNRYLKGLNYLSEHFRQCQQLLQKIPVYKLNRPHNFEVMNKVCSMLEEHIHESAGTSGIY